MAAKDQAQPNVSLGPLRPPNNLTGIETPPAFQPLPLRHSPGAAGLPPGSLQGSISLGVCRGHVIVIPSLELILEPPWGMQSRGGSLRRGGAAWSGQL